MDKPTEVIAPVIDRRRLIYICLLAASLGIWAAFTAKILLWLIEWLTCVFFQGEFGPGEAPIRHHLGWLVVLIPPLGGLIVGLIARFGSEAIRGHGIPEAMENILLGRSRIHPRILILKPISAAISIGSGGPFGAEGPIIQTGGALGSVLSQFQALTAVERKGLLAAGAAAGMAATFQAPVAAVLMAVELLLFELRPRTLLPVAIASAVAAGMRLLIFDNGAEPLFPLTVTHSTPTPYQLLLFVGLGLVAGLVAVGLTRGIYWIEDTFRRLSIHWMWWPALGGVVVGLVGLVFPAALGVGYDVITAILNNNLDQLDLLPWAGDWGQLPLVLLLAVVTFKTLAWCVSLGSGTSGGVLAPVLMIGGAVGGALGLIVQSLHGGAADPSLWALVCMAGVFAGTTRAPLTSIVFALELTHDLPAFLPLLLVCALCHLVSVLLLPYSIMTEKLARRGLRVGHEYELDVLATLRVQDVMTAPVQTVPMNMRVEKLFEMFYGDPVTNRYQAYPVVDEANRLVGMVSKDDLPRLAVLENLRWLVVADLMSSRLIVAHPDEGLRQAAQRMVMTGVGRLPVVDPTDPGRLVGILSHRDVFKALARRLEEEDRRERFLDAISWLFSTAPRATDATPVTPDKSATHGPELSTSAAPADSEKSA
jgi:H+/Cl- antiporter ClcA/predicted transcriptional regulator